MEEAIGLYQGALQSGSSLEQITVDLCEYFRALLLLQSGLSERQLLLLLPYPPGYYSARAQQSWNREQLCHILERCFALYRDLRYSINEHFEFELLLFEIADLKNYHSGAYQLNRLEELTAQLQNGEIVFADPKNDAAANDDAATLDVDRASEAREIRAEINVESAKKKTALLVAG